MNEFSDLLFGRPSFSEGIGRVLDFGGTLDEYNRSVSTEQADRVAIRADWEAVGNDIMGASRQCKKDGSKREANG